MLLDGNDDTPGPAPGCEAAPSEADRITAGPAHINAATGDITLSGTKMTDADGVDVTLTDSAANTAGPFPATVTGNSWTLTITAAQRAGLVDGKVTASSVYDHGGTALVGKGLTIAKDVIAPTLTATPGAGTFTGATSVTLAAGPGEEIRYRLDGGQATAGDTLYTGPIALPFGTTTLGVRVADAAGNATTRMLTYTVNRPAAPPAQQSPPAPAVPLVIQSLAVNRPAPVRLVATARGTSRVTLRSVRRSGLGVAFTAPAGTKAGTAKLYRLRGSAKSLVASKSMRLGAGRKNVRFAGRKLRTGSYLVQIRVGTSSSALGTPTAVRVQIVR
jgi:hypothetical protein